MFWFYQEKPGLVWIEIINIGLILVSDVALQNFFRNGIDQNTSGAILFKRSGIKKKFESWIPLELPNFFKVDLLQKFQFYKKKFKSLDRLQTTRSVLSMRCSSTKSIKNMNRIWSTQFPLGWFFFHKIWPTKNLRACINQKFIEWILTGKTWSPKKFENPDLYGLT